MRPPLAVLLLLALFSRPAASQLIGRARVDPRMRVRVTAPRVASEPMVGTYLSADGDTLRLLATEGMPKLAVPVTAVQRFEVSEGRARVRWARRGALAGLVFGLVLGATNDDGAVFISGLLFAPPAGAVAGALMAPERWRDAPIDVPR
jgi:hypothetical protein